MPRSARFAAVLALIPAAERFPDVPLTEVDLSGLGGLDAGLATAIHRTVLQRWLTLEHLLARHLKKPIRKLAPETRAVLLSGAAQLVFMDRIPAYAVIDQSVGLMKGLRMPKAAGAVNAVLRKLADDVAGPSDEPWTPGVDRVPVLTEEGECVTVNFRGKVMPKPDNLLAHLVVATSHPMPLLQRWFKQFGRERATALALHSLRNPPTFVVQNEKAEQWGGSREELIEHLAADPARRVQDPASLASVAAVAELLTPTQIPGAILDLCAGRGTKTRQLQRVFPQAAITAHDPDDGRRADLERIPGVAVAEPAADQRFDLIVLDVPCSNTGVLARRSGARYRATAANLDSLVELQRQIMARALPHLAPGGRVLYCTCSIDPAENQQQAAWLAEQVDGLAVLKEATLLPTEPLAGAGEPGYHDGSYHAVVGPPPAAG